MLRFLCLITLFCSGFFADLHAAEGPLDGHSFAIDFTPNKDDPEDRPVGSDVLVFSSGLGDCQKANKAYGFQPKAYSATMKKGVITFSFSMVSEKHGELSFKGQIKEKLMQGVRTWSKPGKTPIVHNFTGKKS